MRPGSCRQTKKENPLSGLCAEDGGFSLFSFWMFHLDNRVDSHVGICAPQRLQLQEKIGKLTKLIEKTERAAWKEVQPKKKFALFQKLKGYKKEWEDLQRGKA